MITVGRYTILFGRKFRVYIVRPTIVYHFLWFSVLRKARPEDVDQKPQFPLDTRMVYKGKTYRYFRAPKDLKKGEVVLLPPPNEQSNQKG